MTSYTFQILADHEKSNLFCLHLKLKYLNFLSSGERCTAKIEDFSIKNITKEKLLEVKFDCNISFQNHVTSLCKKGNQKLHAFVKISHYMVLDKRRNVMKTFITSQFFYYPLIWMFPICNLIRLAGYMNNLLDQFIKII